MKVLFALALAWIGLSQMPVRADNLQDRDAIIDMMAQWEVAVESADFEKLENFYAEDAIYYPNHSHPLTGRNSIVEKNRQRGADAHVDITQQVDNIEVNGDWAVYSCRATVRVSTPQAAEARERQVRVLLLLERGEDGQWRILRDIDNEPPVD